MDQFRTIGRASIPVLPAKVEATGIVFFWDFITRNIWVFEK
jgi:hypothetical protein